MRRILDLLPFLTPGEVAILVMRLRAIQAEQRELVRLSQFQSIARDIGRQSAAPASGAGKPGDPWYPPAED